MINTNYRVAVYGSRLHKKSGRFIGELCAVKMFYFKKNIVKWAREQINRPDIHPTSVKFYFKKDNVWILKLKVRVHVPKNKNRMRTLIWEGRDV